MSTKNRKRVHFPRAAAQETEVDRQKPDHGKKHEAYNSVAPCPCCNDRPCVPCVRNRREEERRTVLVGQRADGDSSQRQYRSDFLDGAEDRKKKDTVFAIGLEALKWMGATSRQVGVPYPDLWCADFVNFVLRRTGYPTTNSRAAKSFLEYGKRIDTPRVGAIVVLTRGNNGGHVGIVRGTDGAGNIVVISGNHGNKIGRAHV